MLCEVYVGGVPVEQCTMFVLTLTVIVGDNEFQVPALPDMRNKVCGKPRIYFCGRSLIFVSDPPRTGHMGVNTRVPGCLVPPSSIP